MKPKIAMYLIDVVCKDCGQNGHYNKKFPACIKCEPSTPKGMFI